MEIVRATRSASQAEEWALVLAAAGIAHRVKADDAGWTVLVPAVEARRARAALDAYDADTRPEPDVAIPEAASPRLAWAISVVSGALLLAFFAVTGPPAAGPHWFARGAAVAERIMSGEPWRAVTALTLHVDAVHVAGNAVAMAVLLPAIVQRFGPGWGLALVLLAGAGANVLAAMAQDPRHAAVGASTAIFGAIGILAALRLLPGRSVSRRRLKAWTVLVAAVLLLAMLGTGRGADVLGHGLGLLTGGTLGVASATLERPLGAAVQWSLVGLTALAVAGCWRLALTG